MFAVIPPIEPGSKGPAVVNLQDGLRRILSALDLPAADRDALLDGIGRESQERVYADATIKVVSMYQERRQLPSTGTVDAPTAEALNADLARLGGLDSGNGGTDKEVVDTLKQQVSLLRGIGGDTDTLPLISQGIRGIAEANTQLILGSRAPAVAELHEQLTQAGFVIPRSELDARVFGVGTRDAILQLQHRTSAIPTGTVDAATRLSLDVALTSAVNANRIEGRILLDNGLPADNLELRLVDKGFGGAETELGSVRTDAAGFYTLDYNPDAAVTNLAVHARDVNGESVQLSEPTSNVGRVTVLNLVAPSTVRAHDSEFDRLAGDLAPHIGGDFANLARAQEDDAREDIGTLTRATGWDARVVALAASAAKVGEEAGGGLPAAGLYGLLRAGLPADSQQLAQLDPAVVPMALATVRDAGVIGLDDDEIAGFADRFATFANTTLLARAAPGSTATFGDLLTASGLPAAARDKFAPVYLRHNGDAADLWDAARAAGLDEKQVGTLQLQGKFAFLSGNSAEMTTHLMSRGIEDPVALVEQDLYEPGRWKEEVRSLANGDPQRLAAVIPAAYQGDTVDGRLEAYAQDMARKVRLSYPTHVLSRTIERDDVDAFGLGDRRDDTAAVLKAAADQGYRLGQTPPAAYFAAHPVVRGGRADGQFDGVLAEVQKLHRVFQITPSDEAMKVLLATGLHSAHDVVAVGEKKFIELYGASFADEKEAHLVYRKAAQVNQVTYNLFTMAKALDAAPAVHGLSPSGTVRQNTKDTLIKHFPTMESLFGSTDYCECEHCRSVLSPAAYLVDLLQFVDIEAPVWAAFVASWAAGHQGQAYASRYLKPYDALVERRPDLVNIELSCENTNTEQPYIDLVNKILEYYVANDGLAEEAAPNVGGVASEDLIAEPQGVIREAYDRLLAARYPLTLPFDLWLETVRKFSAAFDVPFARVLEVFRPGDDLFAPTQPYDRAAIFLESLGLTPAEAAVLTDPGPLDGDAWHTLYGLPAVRPVIRNPSNADPVTVAIADPDAATFGAGDLCTYFDMSAAARSAETRTIIALGAAGSGGAGLTKITFDDTWTNPPQDGDLLVYDAPAVLRSAKTLSRRLGVTYQELVDLVETAFANPGRQSLVLLRNLGVSVQDARFAQDHRAFYDQNKDLLGANRDTLPAADRARYDALSRKDLATGRTGWADLQDVQAFDERVTGLAAARGVPAGDLHTALQAIGYDRILVLADPQAGTDFSRTLLRRADGKPADAEDFLRLNLLVRLWRALGWTLDETDRALVAFVPRSAPFDAAHFADRPLRTALVYLAHLNTLDEQLRPGPGGRLRLLSLWSDLATDGPDPLYATLFLTPGMLRLDDVFDHPLGLYLTPPWITAQQQSRVHSVELAHVAPADRLNPADFTADPKLTVRYDDLEEVQHLSYRGVLDDAAKAALLAMLPAPSGVLSDLLDAVQRKAAEFRLVRGHLSALQSALGMTGDEIGLLVNLDTAELSLPAVSLLYRHGFLARSLGLSVGDLNTLRQLSGIDPFTPLHPGLLTTSDQDHPFRQTLAFVDVAGAVADGGLTVTDLDYLLRHRFDPVGPYREKPDQTAASLITLAEGVRAIRAEHAVPDDPGTMSDEAFRQELGLVLAPAVGERFLALLVGSAEFTATAAGIAPADRLDQARFAGEAALGAISYDEVTQTQSLTVRGVLFDARKTRIRAAYAGLLTAGQRATLATLLDQAQTAGMTEANAFFAKHLQKQPVDDTAVNGFLDPADFALLFDPDVLDDPDQAAQRQHDRRAALARSFLPFLQQRLIRQFLVRALTADAGPAPALAEGLLTDKDLLSQGGQPLLDVVVQAAQRGVTAVLFGSADRTGAPLRTSSLPDADLALVDADIRASVNSTRIEGYLQVSAAGSYRFYVRAGAAGATAKLRFGHLPAPTLTGTATPNGLEIGADAPHYAVLKPLVPYRFTLDLEHLGGAGAQLLVQSESLPKDPLAQLVVYPAARVDATGRALLLLAKAQQLAQALGLSETEIRYLLTHARDFGDVDLSALPTVAGAAADAGAAALFGQFRRLAGYARLKQDLAAGTDDLIGVFQAGDDLDAVCPLIATLTRRDETAVRAAANALSAAPSFTDERPLARLWEALQIVGTFGVPVRSVRDWTRIVGALVPPEERFGIARDLKDALRARFSPDAWRRVAQPVFDVLRARQRDALARYVMQRRGFDQLEQLYEFFLVDPGMEPVIRTSPIRLAISSVQMFIQRCLLNLEAKVPPAAIINAPQWEWMKRYRVWEANRKIFLFPENFLEPEFRDDKTRLFTELEGSLLQGDLSDDQVADAFLTYLTKLEQIARLDIIGMYLEEKDDPANNVLHVIGRTHGSPHAYHYRRYAHRMWTEWEPVDAQIDGDHVVPVVWRDRLHLFWITFTQTAVPTTTDVTVDYKTSITFDMAVPVRHQANLHWCEYLGGRWSTPEGTEQAPPVPMTANADSLDPRTVFVHVAKEDPADGQDLGVFITVGAPFNRSFYLAGRNSTPTLEDRRNAPANPYTAKLVAATRYAGSGTVSVTFTPWTSTEPGRQAPTETPVILDRIGAYTLLPTDNAASPVLGDIGPLIRPVVVQDALYTLFAEPSLTERTVAEWEEWVTRIPVTPVEWSVPKHWKDLRVAASYPKHKLVPVPEEEWRISIDPKAKYSLNLNKDWVADPQTTLTFGDQVIGSQGRITTAGIKEKTR